MLTPNLLASSCRKLPVPAAHTLFMSKSSGLAFSSQMYLESCPPISKTVSTLGSRCTAARACAVISSITRSARMKSPTTYRPEPVVAVPNSSSRSPNSSRTPARRPCVTSMGLPWVCTYCLCTMSPSVSIKTVLVVVDPTSMPR